MLSVEKATITDAEKIFCEYKLGRTGSGYTALFDCIFKMDMPNRTKIGKGFPELVEVVNRFNQEQGYWLDLVTRWNSSHDNARLYY